MSASEVDVAFPDSFRFGVSPDLADARKRNLQWAQRSGLASGSEAIALYESWDVTRAAACMYPYARGEDLALVADHMGFWYPFDDQFDSPLGLDPASSSRVCEELIAVLHRAPSELPAGSSLAAKAFADIWSRSLEGMPMAWRARAAHNWEYYFASYPHEVIARCDGVIPDWESFLRLRIGVSAMSSVADLCERVGGFEVPAVAFHSLPLIEMRKLTWELPCMANDILTLDREEPRGDVVNLILVIEKEQQCSRDSAIETAYGIFNKRLRRFSELKEKVPELGRRLGLDVKQRDGLDRYADALEYLITGYYSWAIETARFTPEQITPPDRPGYPEDLLQPIAR
jgi:avermitilol synthase